VGCLLRLEPNKQAQVVYSSILHAIIPLHWATLFRVVFFWLSISLTFYKKNVASKNVYYAYT
jgi:hypothetical protein